MTYEIIESYLSIFRAIGPQLIFALAVVALLVIGLLLLRPFRLWYWKVDKKGKELENINAQIYELRREMDARKAAETAACVNKAEASPKERTARQCTAEEARNKEALQMSEMRTERAPEAARTAECEKSAESASDSASGTASASRVTAACKNETRTGTDKKGRTYTEEEIEKLIQD